ncbi:MAG TPA: hypothetical protein VGN63_16805 [Flavisolibacter sp.]|nr:hypothetical protein [Flavisolibacter sp.]
MGAGAAPSKADQRAVGAKGKNLERKAENLESIINPGGGRKRKTPDAILQFVRDKFETAEAISEAVGKSAAYLKNEVLPKMVEDRLLVLKYPETPTHRSQAYKAAPKEQM